MYDIKDEVVVILKNYLLDNFGVYATDIDLNVGGLSKIKIDNSVQYVSIEFDEDDHGVNVLIHAYDRNHRPFNDKYEFSFEKESLDYERIVELLNCSE